MLLIVLQDLIVGRVVIVLRGNGAIAIGEAEIVDQVRLVENFGG